MVYRAKSFDLANGRRPGIFFCGLIHQLQGGRGRKRRGQGKSWERVKICKKKWQKAQSFSLFIQIYSNNFLYIFQ